MKGNVVALVNHGLRHHITVANRDLPSILVVRRRLLQAIDEGIDVRI
jgi:hypothetical protein